MLCTTHRHTGNMDLNLPQVAHNAIPDGDTRGHCVVTRHGASVRKYRRRVETDESDAALSDVVKQGTDHAAVSGGIANRDAIASNRRQKVATAHGHILCVVDPDRRVSGLQPGAIPTAESHRTQLYTCVCKRD